MKRLLFSLPLLLLSVPCYAQPSTGYASATPDAPGNDGETGFTFIVDLSDMPASWWSTAENTDATRGRVYRNDGTTELAVDWIDYDDSTETGYVRFKDDMALSPTTYRIYPPVSGNSTVAASATYGSDNAYDSNWEGYWPNGGGDDRTSNGNDGTANGGVTVGGVAGQTGDATDFDGTGDYIALSGGGSLDIGTSITVIAWADPDTVATNKYIFGAHNPGSPFNGYALDCSSSTNFRFWNGVGWGSSNASSLTAAGGWFHVAATNNNTTTTFYSNGSAAGTASQADPGVYAGAKAIAARGDGANLFDGKLCHVQVHSTDRTAEWIDEEYKATNDNTAYWSDDASSGWTWTAASVSGNPDPLTPTIPGGTPDPLRRTLP